MSTLSCPSFHVVALQYDTLSMFHSPFITNCVMRGELPLDACVQGYHVIVGNQYDPAAWSNSDAGRLTQVRISNACCSRCVCARAYACAAQSVRSDESIETFELPMLDSVLVQVCVFVLVWLLLALHIANSSNTGAQWHRLCCSQVQVDPSLRRACHKQQHR